MQQTTSGTPLVSLVIPVYNAMPYLRETLDALPAQGLDESQLEVVLVNDGSDDGSEKLLAEYAARHPNYRLIDQPNSGGPADPCNKGIAAVRGKYFFVVGADDVLTEGALGDLAAYAEKEGSDIVLAKMAGLNGRHAPSSMFHRTVADADIVADKLYNSLTAIKLFRTDLVAKTGAHNPTHLRVGSDQPFTLACYLAADKISVRADRDFVLIRKRDDGKNVTSSARSAWDYAQLLAACIEVIVQFSEPGTLRDGILRRPIRGALRKSLHPRFLDLEEEKQEAVVAEIAQALTPVYTPAAAAHLGPLEKVKVRLALDGRTAVLRRLITWEKGGGRRGSRMTRPDSISTCPRAGPGDRRGAAPRCHRHRDGAAREPGRGGLPGPPRREREGQGVHGAARCRGAPRAETRDGGLVRPVGGRGARDPAGWQPCPRAPGRDRCGPAREGGLGHLRRPPLRLRGAREPARKAPLRGDHRATPPPDRRDRPAGDRHRLLHPGLRERVPRHRVHAARAVRPRCPSAHHPEHRNRSPRGAARC
ncbi:glycosyltransferase family 2 protein [Brachybacterium sp. Z12]|uniref:glycosyltransferase family 2 protein n=1 Tax=Brachybacterium sp. Z12 TaxID=2759167 RepID=UPI00185F88FA|nr:glycosyltransferase family 2 protein [Brachybacterium sp. Z12]QNN82173.1 glycosyltransferase family 2 protein [Brachybacterium sp. Z12]